MPECYMLEAAPGGELGLEQKPAAKDSLETKAVGQQQQCPENVFGSLATFCG